MRHLHILFISALSFIITGCATEGSVPEGFQSITAIGRQFTFALPKDWKRDTQNSYKFGLDKVFYEVFPARSGTLSNCTPPFGSSDRWENYELTLIEVRPYDNGSIKGCHYIVDYLNLKDNVVWRHTIFQFLVDRSVAKFILIAPTKSFDPKDSYDPSFTKTIIDSITINHGL
ncbi:hypothetical protein [Herbaspirillum robiniae]|uniref:hypothetical protein n=1 Tax=Herbaspirillum robiniae TaxID=2014887 RepID=UPI003D78A81A